MENSEKVVILGVNQGIKEKIREYRGTESKELLDPIIKIGCDNLVVVDEGLVKLYSILRERYYKFLGVRDVDDLFIEGVMKAIYKVDLGYDEGQVYSYIRTVVEGIFKSEYVRRRDELGIYSKVDVMDIIDKGNQEEEEYKLFRRYIKSLGGYESFLTGRQVQILELCRDNSLVEVSEKLNVSKQSVSKTVQRLNKEIRKKYITYRLVRMQSNQGVRNVTHEIKKFLDDYNLILQCDVEGSFDYFGYVNSKLRELLGYSNVGKGYTVEGVIEDYSNVEEYKVIKKVIDDYVYGDKEEECRVKEMYVYRLIVVFNRYLLDVEEGVRFFLTDVVDRDKGKQESTRYNKIIKVFEE